MKLNILILGLLLCAITNRTVAQTESNNFKNNIYVELLGNGLLWSLNYERFLSNNSLFKVGFGYWPNSQGSSFIDGSELFVLPVDYCYLFDLSNNSKIDLGVGLTLMGGEEHKNEILINSIIGYRYQPHNGGFLFRASITPFFLSNNVRTFWFGLSFGQNF